MADVLMSRETGQPIDSMAHLIQSIKDIITTKVGERVIVRDYGCELPNLVDQPINSLWAIRVFGALADALDKWEPRLRVYRVGVDASQIHQGVVGVTIDGLYLPTGRVVKLENIQVVF